MTDTGSFSPIKYLFDEHVRHAIALALRRHGIDVLTADEAGRAHKAISDDEQVSFAEGMGRIFVSNDTDVLNPNVVPRIATGQHAGIVYIEQNVSIGEQVRYLRFIAETETPASIAGQIRFYQPIPHGIFDDD